ncbi:ABC transporter ATP-binding protein [Alteromonas sp. KUL17]|uniref:ABC transporter ATP-binding protein n=1 Tax=Alteromonas sp. KUL17 TaxID=2480796 RepID=UPI0010378765|nr:ABC transporter ATP-binding protein [Alteromonas sp. KUL17]TAP29218.1 ABC transporter ATP-binding protein [Alteromonas sp. KUL17]GEA02591.1 ABC transporter ATP-binding protein [Alteromonas sp. KUL17]
MPPLIELSNITKRYEIGEQEIFALHDVALSIADNEFVAILGSSGSGKSTMMNILGCLDRPTSGDYHLGGRRISEMSESSLSNIRNQQIGFVFQNFNLIPNLSALKNVMHPLVYRRIPQKQKVAMARAQLAKVGLANREAHLPSELSGGQRQRVAIARALITQPSLILADEPTGNLDSTTTEDIMTLFRDLHDDGQTVVLVTHDDNIAQQCHRRVTLVDGKVAKDCITV